MKHSILNVALAAVLIVTAFGCTKSPPQSATSPNVVFILVDALRADRIEAQRGGEPISPVFFELTKESVYFTDTISQCSWTRPSMASIMTSTYEDVHQVHVGSRLIGPNEFAGDALPERLETMAELLVKHGYQSFGVQTNANLTRDLGFAQGFPEGRYIFENGYLADWVTDRALENLDSLEQPFFLYTHYIDPHTTYEPPESYKQLWQPHAPLTEQDRALLAPERFPDLLNDIVMCVHGTQDRPATGRLSPAGREAARRLYDGEVRFAGDQVDRLLRRLERDFPNTILVFLSDHGEEFWEHDGMAHGTTLYEEQLRVPFMIRAPGLEPRRVEAPVETIDLLPTLAGMLGLPRNPAWQGRDILADAHPQPRPRFSRLHNSLPVPDFDAVAVQQGSDKLLVDKGAEHLYLIDQDPEEKKDFIDRYPEKAAELRALLARHSEDNAERRKAVGEATSAPLSEDDIERLRALGYFGPDGADNEANRTPPSAEAKEDSP